MGHKFENLSGTYQIDVNGEVREYDLSDPDQAEKVANLISKGNAADKKWEEMAEIRRQNEAWNELLEGAKDDPESREKLVGMLEAHLGTSLTPKQEKELDEIMDGSDDKPNTELLAMKKELEEFKNMVFAERADREFKELEKKYDDFDRKSVIELMNKGRVSNPEDAYFILNKEKIIEKEKKKWEEEEKKRLEDIKNMKSPSQKRTHVDAKPPVDVKGKSYDDLAVELLKEAKEQGRSFIKE